MLRFDAKQSLASQPYFHVNFVSYVSGLALTVGVMHFFDSAQPALLYLVPVRATLLSVCRLLWSVADTAASGTPWPLSNALRRALSSDARSARRSAHQACILSSLLTAVARGELSTLLAYSEEKSEEKPQEAAEGGGVKKEQ